MFGQFQGSLTGSPTWDLGSPADPHLPEASFAIKQLDVLGSASVTFCAKFKYMTPVTPERCHPPRGGDRPPAPHTRLCLQVEVGTLAPRPKEPQTLPELGGTTTGTPKPSRGTPKAQPPIPGQGELCSPTSQGWSFWGQKIGIFAPPAALCKVLGLSLLTKRGRRAAEREKFLGKKKKNKPPRTPAKQRGFNEQRLCDSSN